MHIIEWLLFIYLWGVPAPAFRCEYDPEIYIGMGSKGKGYKWLGRSHSEECLSWVEWLKREYAERIVIGDDGSVWYTNDHYYTFTRIE